MSGKDTHISVLNVSKYTTFRLLGLQTPLKILGLEKSNYFCGEKYRAIILNFYETIFRPDPASAERGRP
jgi:hypothetical protein